MCLHSVITVTHWEVPLLQVRVDSISTDSRGVAICVTLVMSMISIPEQFHDVLALQETLIPTLRP